MQNPSGSTGKILLWTGIFFTALLWSAINPRDRLTWLLEVAPALLAILALALSYSRFRLTPLAYWLILLHSVILMIGGHYTYAEVPAFNWLRDYFDLARNNYDKVGHLAQGFIPAIIAREILLRRQVVNGRRWLNVLIVCICLAISACYELIEWLVALLSGEAADAFLGTQGDIWDTQSDMALALLGAILALLLLTGTHDRQLSKIGE